MTWISAEISAIVVAVITAAGGIIVAVISRPKRKKGAGKPALVDSSLPPDSPPIPFGANRIKDSRIQLDGVDRPIHNISHCEIEEKSESIPPFHRDAFYKEHLGMRVQWRIAVRSISQNGDGQLSLYGNSAPYLDVHCDGRKEDFLFLIHAKEKDEVDVVGDICHLCGGYAKLKNCIGKPANKHP